MLFSQLISLSKQRDHFRFTIHISSCLTSGGVGTPSAIENRANVEEIWDLSPFASRSEWCTHSLTVDHNVGFGKMRIQASGTLNQLLVPAAQNAEIKRCPQSSTLRCSDRFPQRGGLYYSTALHIAYISGHHGTVELPMYQIRLSVDKRSLLEARC